jgi:hypothetical protein
MTRVICDTERPLREAHGVDADEVDKATLSPR